MPSFFSEVIANIFIAFNEHLLKQSLWQFKFEVFYSIKAIAEVWNKFLPQQHHLHSSELEILERTAEADFQFQYIIITRKGAHEIIALAYIQLFRFRYKHYLSPINTYNPLKMAERLVMASGFNIAVCGNLFRLDNQGAHFNPSEISFIEVISIIEKALRKHSIHAYLLKDCQEVHPELRQLHYEEWQDDLTMKMNIPQTWHSFDDYVSALKHRYAQRARNIRKTFSPVTRRELSLNEIQTQLSEIHELYLKVVERQRIRMGTVKADYFNEMKKLKSENFRMFGYYIGEKMVAFTSNIVRGKQWEMHYIGMNYTVNTEHQLYFNILFDGIENAINYGLKEVEMGRTARVAKASVGTSPVYFNNYYKVKNKLIREIVSRLKKQFNEAAGSNWGNRSPFKKG